VGERIREREAMREGETALQGDGERDSQLKRRLPKTYKHKALKAPS
jgi:hypothetical protein